MRDGEERSDELKVINYVVRAARCFCYRFASAVLRSSLDLTFLRVPSSWERVSFATDRSEDFFL